MPVKRTKRRQKAAPRSQARPLKQRRRIKKSLRRLGPVERERAVFFDGAAGSAQVLGAETERGFFFSRTTDMGVGRGLFIHRRRPEMALLVRAMETLEALGVDESARAGTFIDVGANIGTSTVTAVIRCGFATAVACEPEPYNHWLLRLNVAANRAEDCVRTLPVAVSNEKGEIDLLVNPTKSGGHEVEAGPRPKAAAKAARSGLPPPETQTTRVETVTLDWLVERSIVADAPTGLLWMDAQGHEGHVLDGAGRLLRHGIPIILELAPRHLARHGGLDMLLSSVKENYSHYIPIRNLRGPAGSRGDVTEPIARIDDFVYKLTQAGNISDLMLLRLPS